jgi:methylglutaconyl-CoA hydratase
MLTELSEAFAGFNAETRLRAVMLAAHGPMFCAGVERDDGQDFADADASRRSTEVMLTQVLQAIYACPVPVVAKIQGDCRGAGMALAAACDIVVAAGQAGFCIADPASPAHIIISWLAKAMPARAAQRYLLTAERFSAVEAKHLGLAHEVTAAETLDERAHGIAGALLQADAHAVAERRRLLRQPQA